MDKYRKNDGNTDAEETMFFQASQAGKSTDQYDTQQMNAGQIRQQAAQQAGQNSYPGGGYGQNTPYGNRPPEGGYTQNPYASQGYGPEGYGRPNYPQQNYGGQAGGYRPGGNPSGGYAGPNGYGNRPGYNGQQNAASGGYRPYSSSGGYSTGGNAPRQQNRPASGARPAQRPAQQRAPQPSGGYRPQQQSAPRQPVQQRPPRQRVRQEAPASSAGHRRSGGRKKSLLGRIVKIILSLIIILFLLYSAVAMIGILGMNRVSTGDRSVTSGSMDASYVKNVLVIGTDTRDPEEERGRSDSMILVSMNSRTNELYMTSFMRDAYVEIPGKGSGKLNAAYSYGGPELLMDTLEQNFDVHIDDYVMITFAACADMIDAVGGVEIELSDREADAVNEILISEVNEIMGDDREDDLLDGGGTLKLDGKQALSYSRIRHVGNADFERTERQRTVMQQVMTKAKQNPARLLSICMKALPDMTTNLSVGQLYGYAVTTPLKLAFYETKQQRIPEDGTYSGADINGESVLQIDLDAAQKQLKDTVFAD